MKAKRTQDDFELLAALQGGLAPTSAPFDEVAKRLRMGEEELLARIKGLMEQGAIRRFGATLNPRMAGFQANALVAWKVPRDRMDEVATDLAQSGAVTHCYERRTVPGRWDYNLYTMVHGTDRASVIRFVEGCAAELQVERPVVMFSTVEHKSSAASPQPRRG